jgi:hypothetical protein
MLWMLEWCLLSMLFFLFGCIIVGSELFGEPRGIFGAVGYW